ncbi:unnamed protein product [Pedinophyceae sp. YPF-701]|nr:unnamed protein product [Pedinophyceae sp. YPF-701]
MEPQAQKVIDRAKGLVEEGADYEAHETVKSAFHRLKKKGLMEAAYDVCREGGTMQLERGNIKAGLELGQWMLDSYLEDQCPCDDAHVSRADAILAAFPVQMDLSDVDVPLRELPTPLQEYSVLAGRAARWAQKMGHPEQARRLRKRLGMYAWEAMSLSGLAVVTDALCSAREGRALGRIVAECSRSGKAEERDLFLCRAALVYLACSDRDDTKEGVAGVKSLLAAAEQELGNIPSTPLMHFLTMLMEAIELDNGPLGEFLVQQYAPALARDMAVKDAAEKAIGVTLGVGKHANAGMGGIMQNVMDMLFGGGGG